MERRNKLHLVTDSFGPLGPVLGITREEVTSGAWLGSYGRTGSWARIEGLSLEFLLTSGAWLRSDGGDGAWARIEGLSLEFLLTSGAWLGSYGGTGSWARIERLALGFLVTDAFSPLGPVLGIARK